MENYADMEKISTGQCHEQFYVKLCVLFQLLFRRISMIVKLNIIHTERSLLSRYIKIYWPIDPVFKPIYH